MDWRESGETVRKRLWEYLHERMERSDDLHWPDEGEVWIKSVPVTELAASLQGEGAVREWRRTIRWDLLYRTPGEIEAHYMAMDSKPGRPRSFLARQAATVACHFFDAWRAENEALGISDYGRRGEMREYAARAVVDDLFNWQWCSEKYSWMFGGAKDADSFVSVVRELMEKPKHRRTLDFTEEDIDILYSCEGPVKKLPPKPTPK